MEAENNLYSSDSDGEESFYEFSIPQDCQLPKFLNTNKKWCNVVYNTSDLKKWSEVLEKIDNCMDITEKDRDTIIQCLGQDIVYIHGLKAFFENHTCRFCGIVH